MEYKYNYRFLFETTRFSKHLLSFLLKKDAFVRGLDMIMDAQHSVSDEDIYEVMKKLYYPLWRINSRTEISCVLYKALYSYSKIKFGDARAWEQEFIELDEAGATEY